MIREYKFRGICDEEETTHYGKWIHGYLGYEDCINPIEIVGDKDGDIEDYGIYDELRFIKVRKETIGQSTGLKDKNGVEIYEGDTVKITTTNWWQSHKIETVAYEQAVVSFNETTKEIQFKNKNSRWNIKYHELFRGGDEKHYLEVIGNIHEMKG